MPGEDRYRSETPRTPVAVSPVGRRAARDFWSARPGETCAQALAGLREVAARAAGAPLQVCYVVDDDRRLVGWAPVVALVTAAGTTPVAEVMNPRTIPIPEAAPEEAIQDFFITYGLTSFPVVDREGRLAGVVGVEHFSDLVFDGFEGQVREETYRSVGLAGRDAWQASPGAAARARLPWLLLTTLGGFVAALVLAQGHLPPARLAAMALFLPLCVTLAERVAQRILVLRLAWSTDRSEAARRELLAAVLTAPVVGGLAGSLAYVWEGRAAAALSLGGATAATIVVAAIVALFFPLPDTAAGRSARALSPVALAVADVAAVALYLLFVRLVGGAGTP